MARYRKIDPRIWNDDKFASLSHEGQRTFLFILTHPSMTSLGAFRGTREGLEAELGLDPKGLPKPFDELLSKGLIKYDSRNFMVFAPNFLKYNRPENPNVVKGWIGSIDLLPECPLLAEVLQRAKACADTDIKLSKAFSEALGRITETLSERYAQPLPKGMPIQEQEQEQEQEEVVAEKPKTKREPHVPFPESLPDGWRQDALKVRKEIVPERVFIKLRSRYAPTTTKKTIGMWHRIFLDWVGREFSDGRSNVSDHKNNTQRFDADYYADAKLPDGSIDWGI